METKFGGGQGGASFGRRIGVGVLEIRGFLCILNVLRPCEFISGVYWVKSVIVCVLD